MKKMVYVYEEITRGSGYEFGHSFELDGTRKEAEWQFGNLTEDERDKTEAAIKGYKIDVREGQTAEDAYNAAVEDDEIGDPEYYEEIKDVSDMTAEELIAKAETENYYYEPACTEIIRRSGIDGQDVTTYIELTGVTEEELDEMTVDEIYKLKAGVSAEALFDLAVHRLEGRA